MFIASIHVDDVECSILLVGKHIYTSQDKLVSPYHGFLPVLFDVLPRRTVKVTGFVLSHVTMLLS